MSQIRKDIFTDRWVIVADGDVVQPTDFHFKKFARGHNLLPILREERGRDAARSLRHPKSHIFA